MVRSNGHLAFWLISRPPTYPTYPQSVVITFIVIVIVIIIVIVIVISTLIFAIKTSKKTTKLHANCDIELSRLQLYGFARPQPSKVGLHEIQEFLNKTSFMGFTPGKRLMSPLSKSGKGGSWSARGETTCGEGEFPSEPPSWSIVSQL